MAEQLTLQTTIKDLKAKIEAAWDDRSLLQGRNYQSAVEQVIELLDGGQLRIAAPPRNHSGQDETTETAWVVYEWAKKAVLLYFPMRQSVTMELTPFEYYDKIPLKTNYADQGVRVVPPATARYGAYLAPGVVLMPSYVNIGAYVDSGTMVDTWATVGSCAQIGRNVHLSGGVGIGGVLEPIQARPVVVEDGAFIGSRCIIVEGVHIGREAVLAANVVLTASTKIIDVTGPEPITYLGYVPPRSVVIPGSYEKKYPAGSYNVPCALIIGQRTASTDLKTSLNEALREYGVAG